MSPLCAEGHPLHCYRSGGSRFDDHTPGTEVMFVAFPAKINMEQCDDN